MARHINAGLPIPTFFYGQVYMGSLDPLLISVMFRVLGDSVQTIHITESLLYLLIIVTTVLLARRLSGRRWIAIAAGLLVALPPVVLTLYTTMTLGGYGETLLFGNLILLIGYDVTGERENSLWRGLVDGRLNRGVRLSGSAVRFAARIASPLVSVRRGGTAVRDRRRAMVDLQPDAPVGSPALVDRRLAK